MLTVLLYLPKILTTVTHLKTSKKPSPCFLTVWCIKLKDLWLPGGGLTHEQGNMSITFEGQGSGDINL